MEMLITSRNVHRHQSLMTDIYRFRHRFFVDVMGWSALRKDDGLEIDQFDGPDCVHVVGIEEGQIVSYSRLLPSTKPHLLDSVYPQLLAGGACPTGPDIYEWTRCAVDPARREGRKGADRTTAGMYLAVTEACLHLRIKALLVETHPLLLTRMIELGWKARPLALPGELDGKPVVPIYGAVDEDTLITTRAAFGIDHALLKTEGALAPSSDVERVPAISVGGL